MKIFCSAKELVKRIKRQAKTGRKYLKATYKDKDLISRLYEALLKLSSKKTKNPFGKWSKDTRRYFMEDGIEVSNKYIKRSWISLAIKEMLINTTVIYYYTSFRTIVILKNTDKNQCHQGCEETWSFIWCWWECKTVQTL